MSAVDFVKPILSMSDSRDTDEETAPPEPETGEGKFVFPNGAIYGEQHEAGCVSYGHLTCSLNRVDDHCKLNDMAPIADSLACE